MSAGLMRSNESAGFRLTSSATKFRVLSHPSLSFLNQIVVNLSGIPARLAMAMLLGKVGRSVSEETRKNKKKPSPPNDPEVIYEPA
jgi:hypothetical protein